MKPPMNGPHDGPDQKGDRQLDRDIAQFLVHHGPHDGLGEDMEEVGPHGQDALDAGGHQGRGDDEAAARRRCSR